MWTLVDIICIYCMMKMAVALPARSGVATGTIDGSCWEKGGFFSEHCCAGKGGQSHCWDNTYTFERCCGGLSFTPKGYDEWLAAPPRDDENESYEFCLEFVKGFDFESTDLGFHTRYERCVQERIQMARKSFRQPTLAGQHYPTLLTPGPDGLMFALPAFDFVVSKHVKKHGTYDPEELFMYKHLLPPKGTMVDVGANIGSYAIPLALHVGPEGLIVAAEPFHSLFQLLTANSAINGFRNVHTHHLGMGAKEEHLQVKGPSLDRPNNVGMARIFRPFDETYAEDFMYRSNPNLETVHVTTVDKLVEQEQLQKLNVLKIDVEGHLRAVLDGGQRTIRRFRPIVVAENSQDDSLTSLQQDHGYECRELLPAHETWVCLPNPNQWPMLLERLYR